MTCVDGGSDRPHQDDDITRQRCDARGESAEMLIHQRVPGAVPSAYVNRCRACHDRWLKRPEENIAP